jgi:polar amino acid transport system substrate-binding protein
MRIALILFLLFIVTSCQRSEHPNQNHDRNCVAKKVKESKKITAGLIRQYLPYSYKNEEGQMGFDIDLLNALAKELECEVFYKIISLKDIKKCLEMGKVDFVMGVTATKSGSKSLDYSIPYNSYTSSLLLPSDSSVESLEDLKSKNVAYITGASTVSTLEIAETKAFFYSDPKLALESLKKGEISAIKADHTIISALKSEGDFKIIEEVSDVNKYVFAMAENQSKLRDMINRTLMKFWENSTWQDIYETWFSEGSLYINNSDFHINVIPH